MARFPARQLASIKRASTIMRILMISTGRSERLRSGGSRPVKVSLPIPLIFDLPAQMVAQVVVMLPGNRWTNAQQRATVTMAKGADFTGRALWTTLVWRYPGAQVAACGAVNVGKGSYSACTPFYSFG